MVLTLALDTSTAQAGLALVRERQLLAEWALNLPQRSHAEKLIPALEHMLRLLDLSPPRVEGLAVAIGPGSFTGLRVGVSTARALAQVLRIPLVGVSTLDVLAAGVEGAGRLVAPLVDAKQGYFYSALYRREAGQRWPRRLSQYVALRQEALWHHLGQGKEAVVLVGDGVGLAQEGWAPLGEQVFRAQPLLDSPRPGYLGLLGEEELRRRGGHSPEEVLPLYVRPPAAEANLARRQRKDG